MSLKARRASTPLEHYDSSFPANYIQASKTALSSSETPKRFLRDMTLSENVAKKAKIEEAALAVLLQLEIKPEHTEEFVNVMAADAKGSREEAGCLRFDLLQDSSDPNKFATYEVFSSEEALKSHMEMPYVKAWGAFQYGEKKPVVSKSVLRANFAVAGAAAGAGASRA